MDNRLSPLVKHALKEVLCTIFWYKADLRSFLQECINDKKIISSVDWNNYKRQIVSDVIDILYSDQNKYLGDIRGLINEVCKMNNFRHLEQLEDENKRRKEAAAKLQSSQAMFQKLESIKQEYFKLVDSTDPQKTWI